MTAICATIEPVTENRNGLLLNSPKLNTDFVCKARER